MNSNQAMISAVMLETMWTNRKQDMIDLISPFILYATSKLTSPGQKIDTKKVLEYVQREFSYPDMPEVIVRKVLTRSSYVHKEQSKFYLDKSLDGEIEKMDSRRTKCEQIINEIGEALANYLSMHCSKKKIFSSPEAINCLHQFFARYGLQVGIDDLSSVSISHREYEIDYYIARFIFENKDNNDDKYNKIIDLVKGYFLRLAIYIQPTDGSIKSATYKDTTFIYDTPLLLDLLGYSGEEQHKSAKSLFEAIKRQKGNICYFPHIKKEIISILTAYKYSLDGSKRVTGSRTLEGLDKLNFKAADVEREIYMLGSRLENDFQITEKPLPMYDQNEDGTVDVRKILDEDEIKTFIKGKTKHYSHDNLENDVCSVLAVHRLRKESMCETIETCKYMFVTNNIDFLSSFNMYYKKHVNMKAFPIAMSDSEISAITWVKSGETEKISETQLLKNAYMALQPIPEIMEKLEEVFEKMKLYGKINEEQVVSLRTSRVFKNEIWKNSFGEVDKINELSVQEAQKKYEEQLIAKEKERNKIEMDKKNTEHNLIVTDLNQQIKNKDAEISELNENYEKEIADIRDDSVRKERERQERIRKRIDEKASKKREKYIKRGRIIIDTLLVMLFLFLVVATFLTSTYQDNRWMFVMVIILLLFSVVSMYDLFASKRKLIYRWLEKRANIYETKQREKIREENAYLLDENL